MESGIGGWTEDIFIESMRTGMHMEAARPFLPPMPTYDRLTDEELHAIFAYLRSLKPVENVVPEAKLAPRPSQEK
jgi:cytochrome c1